MSVEPLEFLYPELVDEAMDGMPEDLFDIVISQYKEVHVTFKAYTLAIEYILDAKGSLDLACQRATEELSRIQAQGHVLPSVTMEDILRRLKRELAEKSCTS